MTDNELIDRLFRRDEEALEAVRERYGAYCRAVVHGILDDPEDEEECMADLWLRVWNAVPPGRPEHLKGWLGTVARNCALTCCRRRGRYGVSLEEAGLELAEDLSGGPQERLEAQALGEAISHFLEKQPEARRTLFLRRYWYGDSLEAAAKRVGWTTGKAKMILFRMRNKLREELRKEDFYHG